MVDEDLDFIIDKVMNEGLLYHFNTIKSMLDNWYDVTQVRCPDIEILNQSLELALYRVKEEKLYHETRKY